MSGTCVRGSSRWLAGLLSLLLAAQAAVAGSDASATFAVRVHGVRSSHGELVVVLYGENPDDFLKKGRRLARERVPARAGSVTVYLTAPAPGLYAVAVYHDENGNRKFDRGWLGLPAEGFGVSNNPTFTLRPPTHAESAFRVGPGLTAIDITLRY